MYSNDCRFLFSKEGVYKINSNNLMLLAQNITNLQAITPSGKYIVANNNLFAFN